MIIIKGQDVLISSIKSDICFFKGIKTIYVKTSGFESDASIFGEYETEEEAQTVLEKITNTLLRYHNTEDSNLLIDYYALNL